MKIFISILLFLLSSISIFAQNNEWITIESENKEFSFSIPSDYFYLFDKEGFSQPHSIDRFSKKTFKNVHSVTAYLNGVTMFFESFEAKDSPEGLNYLLSNHPNATISKFNFESFNGFSAKESAEIHQYFYYFASGEKTYLFGIASREKENETINRFLSSIKLAGKTLFSSKLNFTQPTQVLKISNLRETQIEIIKLKNKKNSSNSAELTQIQNEDSKENLKSLVVFFKVRASFTEDARKSGEKGKVKLKVSFLANGHIGKIIVIEELDNGLTENTIRAVKRFKFIPALKNNLPISVDKFIEQHFSTY